MIQRIQTIFLLAAIACISAMSYLHVAELVTTDASIYIFNLRGYFHETAGGALERELNCWSLFAMAQLINLFLLATIFLFKHRIVQMRLCVYNMILSLGLMGMTFFVVSHTSNVSMVAYKAPVVFPAVAFILILLAFRAIRRDHILTQFDRLR